MKSSSKIKVQRIIRHRDGIESDPLVPFDCNVALYPCIRICWFRFDFILDCDNFFGGV